MKQQSPTILLVASDQSGSWLTDQLTTSVHEADFEARQCEPTCATECVQQLLAENREPDAVVLGPGLDRPLAIARQIYRLAPLAQLVFLADEQGEKQLRREMMLAPMIGHSWTIANPGHSDLQRLFKDAVRSSQQRRQLRTSLERINLRLAERMSPDSDEYRKLVVSDRYLASILRSAQDAILSIDARRKILTWNPAAEQMFGYSESAILGRPFEILAPAECKAAFRGLVEALETGDQEVRREELRCRRLDGTLIDTELTLAAVRDDHQRRIAISVIARDVTERKRAEDELRVSVNRFRALMEQSPLSTAIFSPEGQLVDANRAWEKLWGVPRESARQYNLLRDAQLQAKGVLPYIRRGFAGETMTIPAIFYDPAESLPVQDRIENRERWIRSYIYPIQDPQQRIREVVLVQHDVSKEKRAEEERTQLLARIQAEQAIRREKEFSEQVINSSIDGIIAYDDQLRYTLWNPGMQRITGMPRDQVIGRQATEVFPFLQEIGEDRFFLAALEGKTVVSTERPYQVPGTGREGYFEAVYSPLYGNAGEVIGGLGIVREISERKRAEELRRANEAKDEFLAMLAHELRNPLAPIRYAVEVMRIGGIEDPGLQWARDVIDRQVQHMIRVVDDLLDVSRITRGKVHLKLERIELQGVIARAVETSKPLIDEHRHQFTANLLPQPIYLRADPVRMAQVISNLLNNAAKYTPDGGQISLTLERRDREVLVRIRDTGVGISLEMLPHIFDLFTQADRSLDRSQGGLGIGLTLVRLLTEMHGGSVEAHSGGLGQGSEFVVRLPTIDETPDTPASSTPVPGETQLQRSRILVVEDNVDGAQSLTLMLRMMGHEVQMLHEGSRCLEVARSFQPDFILLDIGLPGMNGYEVASGLNRDPIRRNFTLVAMTGYGQDEDRRRTREAGFDLHLVKPVDLEALRTLLSGAKAEGK